jgi:signal transduction histidine kinase
MGRASIRSCALVDIYLSRYRELFDEAPVSIWEEDWSAAKVVLDRMRRDGVTNFREALSQDGALVHTLAYETVVLDFNAATLDIYRAPSKKEFWGFANDDFLTLGEFDMFLESAIQLAEGANRVVVQGWEKNWEGNRFYIQDTVFIPEPYRDDWGRVIHIVEDITHKREAEDTVRRAEKVEALGQLTGSLAHELNNLLGLIASNAELLIELHSEKGRPRELAVETMQVARSGTAFVRQLLAFGRRQRPEARVVELDVLFQDIEALLRRSLGEIIALRVRGRKEIRVWVDPLLLENALLNLALNARDAMPGGGTLTIKLSTISSTDSGGASTAMGRLEVSDTGQGMTQEVLDQAIEPFYTTKPKESGSGLGLSMVENFARQSGGTMTIESEPGQGTTVRLDFPLASAEQLSRVETLAGEVLPSGTETILHIDDDPWFRRTTAELLREFGYTVFQASSGQKALDILDEGKKIDLVLTDIVMPGELDGRDVVRRLRMARNIPAIYLSSYPEVVGESDQDFDQSVPFLHKPVARDELARCIRRLLDGE